MLTRCSIAVLRFVIEIAFDGSAMKDFSQTGHPAKIRSSLKSPPIQNEMA
jgi:hypothetical protein